MTIITTISNYVNYRHCALQISYAFCIKWIMMTIMITAVVVVVVIVVVIYYDGHSRNKVNCHSLQDDLNGNISVFRNNVTVTSSRWNSQVRLRMKFPIKCTFQIVKINRQFHKFVRIHTGHCHKYSCGQRNVVNQTTLTVENART